MTRVACRVPLKGGFVRFALVVACALVRLPVAAQVSEPPSAAVILRDLHDFQEMGSVLYVAAHPDDENNQLIAYLSRGRYYRAAYLSLTRGDGGQNVLGPVFGDDLGVVRTEELLAAGRIDGARQFFSRAVDFGYSKSYKETLRIWNREEVLSDVVRVIREFRPDVVITRFAPWQYNTHGHHTASAIGRNNTRTNTDVVRINAGGTDPVTGQSFAEIADRSRSMHKTQGLGNFARFRADAGPRYETFQLLDGEPATNDIRR